MVDGDKQCIQINALFFLKMRCCFSSSAVAVLVSMSNIKHISASELQLSTRFLFHYQDRFMFMLK